MKITRRQTLSGILAGIAASSSTFSIKVLAADGKNLVLGMSTPPTTIDPHEDSSSPNNATSRHIFDSLINRGPRAENKPQLATAWKNLDTTHWEFTLRQGVKFHDGADFTADDVVASLLRARDKPSKGFASYTRNIASVTAKGPYTVIIETTQPDPLILNSLSRIRIIRAAHAKASVADFDSGKVAIGTGPFKLISYTPGDRMQLTANPDYFEKPADWEHLTLRFLADDGARLAGLLSKDVDIIENVPAEGLARVKSDKSLQVITGQSTRLVYLGMDVHHDVSPFITDNEGKPLSKNPLKDIRVRHALLMSINRPAIVDRIMAGAGTVAHQFVAEGFLGHSDKIHPVAYNPKKAKELLSEAGYPDGFKMTIDGPSGRYVKDSEVLQAVGQMLSQVGITTQVDVMPWSMYANKYPQGIYSMFMGSWGTNTGEVSNPALSLVATRNPDKGTGRYNGGGISDPKIDELLDKATTTMDEAARAPLLQEISEETFNNFWLLPLHYENVILGAKTTIAYQPRADKYTLAYDVHPV